MMRRVSLTEYLCAKVYFVVNGRKPRWHGWDIAEDRRRRRYSWIKIDGQLVLYHTAVDETETEEMSLKNDDPQSEWKEKKWEGRIVQTLSLFNQAFLFSFWVHGDNAIGDIQLRPAACLPTSVYEPYLASCRQAWRNYIGLQRYLQLCIFNCYLVSPRCSRSVGLVPPRVVPL